jgi:hypothetical protein
MKPSSVPCRFTTDWFRCCLGEYEYWRNARHSLLDGEGGCIVVWSLHGFDYPPSYVFCISETSTALVKKCIHVRVELWLFAFFFFFLLVDFTSLALTISFHNSRQSGDGALAFTGVHY